jgi:hypothetical protein
MWIANLVASGQVNIQVRLQIAGPCDPRLVVWKLKDLCLELDVLVKRSLKIVSPLCCCSNMILGASCRYPVALTGFRPVGLCGCLSPNTSDGFHVPF